MFNVKKCKSTWLLLTVSGIVFTLLFTGCSGLKSFKKSQTLAYNAIYEGKTEEARSILKSEKDEYWSIFLIACLELSEGNLKKAEVLSEKLIKDKPTLPDGKVLNRMIKRRIAYPDEGWLESFAVSWREEGSPDLKMPDALTEGWTEEKRSNCNDMELPKNIRTSSDKLLYLYENHWMFCNRGEYLETAIASLKNKTPFEIRLLALHEVGFWGCKDSECDKDEISEELCDRIKKAKEEAVHQLAVEFPSYIQFALMDILKDASEKDKFTKMDIERIEEAVKRESLAPSRYEIYSLFLKRLREIGKAEPYILACNFTSFIDTDIYFLAPREKYTTTAEEASAEIRERLASIHEKLGKEYLKRKTVIGYLNGLGQLRYANELRKEGKNTKEIEEIYNFVRSIYNSKMLSAIMAGCCWPVKPLMREYYEQQMKDEIGLYLLLTGKEMPESIKAIIDE